jgi:hypothetical protein
LKITERVVTNNPDLAAKVLPELKAKGIKVQMDAFGRVIRHWGIFTFFSGCLEDRPIFCAVFVQQAMGYGISYNNYFNGP